MHQAGQHHLHVRKRVYKKLEPFPHTKTLVRLLDQVMPLVALIGPIALIPQVTQILLTKDVSSLSLPTWLLWEVSGLIWLTYGIVHKELPIILANAAYFILQGVVVVAIVVY